MNVLFFGLIEERAVKWTRDKLIRVSIVVVTSLAWISITNHCALGALIPKINSAMAPMHCHGNQPAPSKKSSDDEMPCCKMLRATITSEAKIVEAASQNFVPIQNWILSEVISAPATQLSPLFAESVLQQSILAHAPPSLG